MPDKAPIFFPTPADFRAWLEEHHDSSDQLTVGYFRKATGRRSVTWEETVEEALCFGWIDGVRRSFDTESYVIRFSPRKPKSVWSERNINLVNQLIDEGRMTKAGLAAFARKDVHEDSGYRASLLTSELSAEMTRRFESNPLAWEFFQEQPPGYRRQSIYWVMSAKREETRQRRYATLLKDSEDRLRIKAFRKR